MRNFLSIKSLLVILIAAEFTYIFGILLNYDNAWLQPEKYMSLPVYLANGNSLQIEDITRGFDPLISEYDPNRISRPFSGMFELLNTKFRVWLWQYMPPHPSLSLSWPLFFILMPILLFKAFVYLGFERTIAVMGVALYLVTIGFLGPIIMLFHPGKSFVNFFAVLALFLAARLSSHISAKELDQGTHSHSNSLFPYFILSLTVFLSFFWDETGVWTYVMVFVLFAPDLFLRAPRKKSGLAIYVAIPILYLFSLKGILPWLHRLAGHAQGALDTYSAMPSLSDLTIRNILTNLWWQYSDQFLFTFEFDKYPTSGLLAAAIGQHLAFATFLVLLLMAVFRHHPRGGNLGPGSLSTYRLLASFLLLIGYSLFQAFQLAHQHKTWGIWWYGSLYSLQAAIFLITAFAFILEQLPRNNWMRSLLLACTVIFVINFALFTTYRNNIFKSGHAGAVGVHPQIGTWYFPEQAVFDATLLNQYEQFDFCQSWKLNKIKFAYTVERWRYKKQGDDSRIAALDEAYLQKYSDLTREEPFCCFFNFQRRALEVESQ